MIQLRKRPWRAGLLLVAVLAYHPLAGVSSEAQTVVRPSPMPAIAADADAQIRVIQQEQKEAIQAPILRDEARRARVSDREAAVLRREIAAQTPVLTTVRPEIVRDLQIDTRPSPRPAPRLTPGPRPTALGTRAPPDSGPQPTDPRPTGPILEEVVVTEALPEVLQQGIAQYILPDRESEADFAMIIASNPDVQAEMDNSQSTIVTMPGVVRQLSVDNEEMFLKPYVLVARPLIYEPESETFAGSIMVGVGEIIPGAATRELSRPITFQVYGRGTAAPNPLPVSITTPPHQEIAIRVPAALAGATVRVASLFNPQGVEITLPLEPHLRVYPSSSTIEGFGLGTTTIDISVPGLADPAGRVVSLRTRPEAYLGATRVTLDENGNGSTSVRSAEIGRVSIFASMTGVPDVETQLRFRFPWVTLVASMLGGLAGALIRVLVVPAAKGGGFNKRLFAASAIGGVLIFALYAVGVNVLPVSPTVTVGATLVFAVSGLGAFLGIGMGKNVAPPMGD